MNTALPFRKSFYPVAVLLLAMLFFGSAGDCTDDDDDIDHVPEEGKGALVIDNNTYDDMDVYVDGKLLGEARDGKVAAFDLDPSVYRVVLEQQGGDQSFREDIDILENRNTVLDVTFGSGSRFDVFLYFD